MVSAWRRSREDDEVGRRLPRPRRPRARRRGCRTRRGSRRAADPSRGSLDAARFVASTTAALTTGSSISFTSVRIDAVGNVRGAGVRSGLSSWAVTGRAAVRTTSAAVSTAVTWTFGRMRGPRQAGGRSDSHGSDRALRVAAGPSAPDLRHHRPSPPRSIENAFRGRTGSRSRTARERRGGRSPCSGP